MDQGDRLSNTAIINGRILDNTNASTPVGTAEDDDTLEAIEIVRGSLSKSIYAINGSTSFTSPIVVAPGETVTYRIEVELPSSDIEDLTLVDYLPLPIFDATEITTFNDVIDAAIPPAGTAKFGPDDTFLPLYGTVPTMTITLMTQDNTVAFSYGDYDNVTSPTSKIDILFTVTVQDNPFTDGLFLTNQVRQTEGSTNNDTSVADAIAQIKLTEPVLNTIRKGVIDTNNPAGVFTPTPTIPVGVMLQTPGTCARHTGTIHSGNVDGTFDSNLRNVDAGDRVTYGIVIENIGSSRNGAYDVRIRDQLPPDVSLVTGSICVTDGTGATMPFTNVGGGTGLFGQGIELTDPGPTASPTGALDQGRNGATGAPITNGRNIAVITYDVILQTGVEPGDNLDNTATVFNYAGVEGGPDHTTEDLTNPGRVTIIEPTFSKTIVTTNQAHTTNNNVIIGEQVQYQVTMDIPEGTINDVFITDRLDTGLAFVSIDNIVASPGVSTSQGTFADVVANTVFTAIGSGSANQGRVATLDFGTITNSDTDNTIDETITVTYTAVVINSDDNDRGEMRSNEASWTWSDGNLSDTAQEVTIVEPTLQITKTASPTTGDAGDIITFNLSISHTGASNTDAFNVDLNDVIPSDMTYVASSLSNTTGLAPTTLSESGGTISATWDTFAQNDTSTLEFQVILDGSVVPNQEIINTADIEWTSVPGDETTPQSPHNPLSTERTGDPSDPGGTANDYNDQDSDTVTIFMPSPEKSLVVTSEAHTSDSSNPPRVAVGEIIRYRLVVRLAESTAPNFRIRDRLPRGLTFLDDGTARFVFVSNEAGISSDDSTIDNCTDTNGASSSIASSSVTCPLTGVPPSGSSFPSGGDCYFNFGALTNADTDIDSEYIIVEFNALVDNNSASYSNDAGDNRNNIFDVLIGDSDDPVAQSDRVQVHIAEPSITNISKTILTTPSDAGDTVDYHVTFSNATDSNVSTAFDVVLTDTLPADLILNLGTITATPAGGTSVPDTDNSVGNTVDIRIESIPPGGIVTVEYQATVNSDVAASTPLTNTADVIYTSLPGPNGTSSNPTGSTTPGGSGTETGERDGSGGHNDHTDSDNEVVTLDNPAIDKRTPNPVEYTIGEEVSYDILVTLPEGETQDLVVVDNLPAGLAYVSHEVITTTIASSGVLATDYNGDPLAPTTSTSGGSGDDITFDFGTITTTDDNDTNNNTFLVRLTAVVLNEIGNQQGDTRDNTAALRYTNPAIGTTTIPDPVPETITIIEPVLAINKQITSVPSPADAGGAVGYTVVIQQMQQATPMHLMCSLLITYRPG
ncbi:MAG: isopeptide-forming domain-containing fimbrial protein [Chloroflexi bacterium AL-N15]|nr:isopeptide-forming domain-containing fimbrial protein [Chloroflexi bacterium AL-N5]NOK87569.1 isopeptide-forming domain-containing fimbrial protein [Chloroflexi bacterium AL-N15]